MFPIGSFSRSCSSRSGHDPSTTVRRGRSARNIQFVRCPIVTGLRTAAGQFSGRSRPRGTVAQSRITFGGARGGRRRQRRARQAELRRAARPRDRRSDRACWTAYSQVRGTSPESCSRRLSCSSFLLIAGDAGLHRLVEVLPRLGINGRRLRSRSRSKKTSRPISSRFRL
jgi:hypothetical protein